jgi:hypothetical protein
MEKINIYSIFIVLYTSSIYFITSIIFYWVMNWWDKYISDIQCSLYFFKMILILPHFIQYQTGEYICIYAVYIFIKYLVFIIFLQDNLLFLPHHCVQYWIQKQACFRIIRFVILLQSFYCFSYVTKSKRQVDG